MAKDSVKLYEAVTDDKNCWQEALVITQKLIWTGLFSFGFEGVLFCLLFVCFGSNVYCAMSV